MKIFLNDVNNKLVDKLEESLFDLVNVHTYIWEGTAPDVYNYEIHVEEAIIVEDRDYTLELISILYKLLHSAFNAIYALSGSMAIDKSAFIRLFFHVPGFLTKVF